jgi:hypothetical protein
MMGGQENSKNFLLGNAILAVAMLLLLFMGSAWEALGMGAMVLWIGLVATGVYFLMQGGDKKD